MSDLIPYGFNLESAVDYNERKADDIGWYGNIPEAAIANHPCFAHDAVGGSKPEKERFALEVLAFQKQSFSDTGEHDGKFGQATWLKMQQRYANVPDDASYIMWDGLRKPTPDAKVISYEDDEGYDLHPAGNFSKRKSGIRLIVIHWGGSTVQGLYNYFKNPDRDLSTHFGIGPEGNFQFLDIKHRAWHAGYVNDFAIGIDICQQPTRDYYDYYLNKGYDIEETENQTDRGRSEILSLEPRIATHLRTLVFELCRITGVPARAPRGHVGMEEDGPVFHGLFYPDILKEGRFKGVVGHHHVSETKWDMACWWEAVFGGTELA